MSAHLIGRWLAGSADWHAARVGKMSGARIAAAAGLSPYESPFSLFHRMLGEIGEAEVTAPMEWGTRLEDAVFQKFVDMHPELQVCKTGTWVHDERDWQTGNPDGLIPDQSTGDWAAILEIKTARYDDGWGIQGTDQIPLHYKIQVWWYLDVLGLDKAHVAVLIAGSDYREYIVMHDADECEVLRQIGSDFLTRLASDDRPDIDQYGATYQAIKELHPLIDGSAVSVSDDTGLAVIHAREQLNRAEELDQLARNVLADEIGNAKYANWRGQRLADRRVRKSPGSIPYVQLVNNLPSTDLKEVS